MTTGSSVLKLIIILNHFLLLIKDHEYSLFCRIDDSSAEAISRHPVILILGKVTS